MNAILSPTPARSNSTLSPSLETHCSVQHFSAFTAEQQCFDPDCVLAAKARRTPEESWRFERGFPGVDPATVPFIETREGRWRNRVFPLPPHLEFNSTE